MKQRFLYFFISLLFFGCEKYEDIVGYHEYIVKEGTHFSKGKTLDELTSSVLTYDVIFNETAIYSIGSVNQFDVNKLFGFSDCNNNHQVNSARFGWRWNNNQLEILSYTYVNGIRDFELLSVIELNKSYRFSIQLTESNYFFKIDDVLEATSFERGGACSKGFYYMLFPYFGGDIVAPHDISVFMKRIY